MQDQTPKRPEPSDRADMADLERLQRAARIAGLGHYIWDVVEDRCLVCSEEHAAIHGMSVADYVAQSSTLQGLTHPEDADLVREAFTGLRAGKAFEVEFRIVTPGGQTRFIREIGHPVFDQEGQVIQELGTSQDITRQKQMENDLRAAEELLQAGIEALPIGFASFDADGLLEYFNEEFRVLLSRSADLLKPGLPIEELVRSSARQVSAACGYSDAESYVQDRLGSLRQKDKVWTYRQSTGRWITASQYPKADGGFVSVLRDITREKEHEEKFVQAQKMEAVGQLTGGIAHDFNNLLTVIRGNAELLRELDGDLAPLVRDIVDAAQRGADLTQRLLAFSRRQILNPKPINLKRLVSGFIPILDRTLGATIAVRFHADDAIPQAFADRTQVESALLNLAINARDAMPNGGMLTIGCRAFDRDTGHATDDPGLDDGDYVILSVTDTGTGMTAAQRAQAFEPFYTTKDVGQGSGLGLSMVYGFARQSGGHARLVSTPGIGTTVEVLLPRARGTETPEPEPSSRPVARGCGEDILVIEDDASVRELTFRLLLDLNYNAVCVRDAAMARDIIETNPQISLVLSDVILPGGLSGPDLAAELRGTEHELRFLFMSGYPRDVFEREGVIDPGARLILKPFSQRDLARAIRGALSAA